jgi:hypothetical protein
LLLPVKLSGWLCVVRLAVVLGEPGLARGPQVRQVARAKLEDAVTALGIGQDFISY